VTVLSDANGGSLGLAADDVHYWGLAIGETGNVAGNTIVNMIDASGLRANLTPFLQFELPENVWDFDKNKLVQLLDESHIRSNLTPFLQELKLIDIP